MTARGRVDPRLRPWPPAPGLREEVCGGVVACFAPSPASLALVEAAVAVVEARFGPEPRRCQHRVDTQGLLRRLGAARADLAAPPFQALARALVEGLGLGELAVDLLRLRAVTSGGHRDPAAANAWSLHRDTWYANPPTQLNLWLPLHAVSEGESVQFSPARFGRAVENDSERFELEAFKRGAGFGAASAEVEAVYPSASRSPGSAPEGSPPEGSLVGVALPAGAVVLFSAAQLHGPPRQDSGLTRFSVDLRVVPRAPGPSAPDPDNRSVGDASEDYRW